MTTDNCWSAAGAFAFVSFSAAAAARFAAEPCFLIHALFALMDADKRYAHLKRWQEANPDTPQRDVEAKWRATHKVAAQRLAPFLTDVYPSPPLAPVLDLLSLCSAFYASDGRTQLTQSGLDMGLCGGDAGWPPLAGARAGVVHMTVSVPTWRAPGLRKRSTTDGAAARGTVEVEVCLAPAEASPGNERSMALQTRDSTPSIGRHGRSFPRRSRASRGIVYAGEGRAAADASGDSASDREKARVVAEGATGATRQSSGGGAVDAATQTIDCRGVRARKARQKGRSMKGRKGARAAAAAAERCVAHRCTDDAGCVADAASSSAVRDDARSDVCPLPGSLFGSGAQGMVGPVCTQTPGIVVPDMCGSAEGCGEVTSARSDTPGSGLPHRLAPGLESPRGSAALSRYAMSQLGTPQASSPSDAALPVVGSLRSDLWDSADSAASDSRVSQRWSCAGPGPADGPVSTTLETLRLRARSCSSSPATRSEWRADPLEIQPASPLPERTASAVVASTDTSDTAAAVSEASNAAPNAGESAGVLCGAAQSPLSVADWGTNLALLRRRLCHDLAMSAELPLYGSSDHESAPPSLRRDGNASSAPRYPHSGAVAAAANPADNAAESTLCTAPDAEAEKRLERHARSVRGDDAACQPSALVLRAAILLAVFAPFLFVGLPLLLASAYAPRRRQQPLALAPAHGPAPTPVATEGQSRSVAPLAAARDEFESAANDASSGAGSDNDAGSSAERSRAMRAAAGGASAAGDWQSECRGAAWRLLRWGCRNSGAAFIKWAQWASARPDVFPADLCAVMAQLHDDAPTHTWHETERAIVQAFGANIASLFLSLERQPLASGSVAQGGRRVALRLAPCALRKLTAAEVNYSAIEQQLLASIHTVKEFRHYLRVHRGTLPNVGGGSPHEIVVKVRHPGVARRLRQDFYLLKLAAAAADAVPALRSLRLSESVSQFSATMTAQADLRVEAAHLERFVNAFADVSDQVRIPVPWAHLVSEEAIVETFEPGVSVRQYISQPSVHNTAIVARGVDVYLKMLLLDNFMHSDLHPGNILVDPRPDGTMSLVLLDCGLAEELTPEVRFRFISFLHALGRGDGDAAAAHVLSWAPSQGRADAAGFAAAMRTLARRRCDIASAAGIDLDDVIKRTLLLARAHDVSIASKYASLLLSTGVLVGFAQGLDPQLNLMDAAIPCLLTFNLTGRLTGRLY